MGFGAICSFRHMFQVVLDHSILREEKTTVFNAVLSSSVMSNSL